MRSGRTPGIGHCFRFYVMRDTRIHPPFAAVRHNLHAHTGQPAQLTGHDGWFPPFYYS